MATGQTPAPLHLTPNFSRSKTAIRDGGGEDEQPARVCIPDNLTDRIPCVRTGAELSESVS